MNALASEAGAPITAPLEDVYDAFYAEQVAKANSRMARLYGTSSIISNAATSAARYNAIPEVTSILAAAEQVSPAGTSACKTCHPILEGSLAILRFFWSWIIAPVFYLGLYIILVVGTPWLLYQVYNVAAIDIPRRIRELPRNNVIQLLRMSFENLYTRVRRTYYYFRFHPVKDELLNRYRTIVRWMEQRRLYILFLVPAFFAVKAIWLSHLKAEGPVTAWTELDGSDVPWYMQIDRKEVGSNHFGDSCTHIPLQERNMDDLADSMDFDVPDDGMDMGVNGPDEGMDMDMDIVDDVVAKRQLNETKIYSHEPLTYTLLVTLTETHKLAATVTETEYVTITVSGSMTTLEVEQDTVTRMQLTTPTETNEHARTVTENKYAAFTLPQELHITTEPGERTKTIIETVYKTVSSPQSLHTTTETIEHTKTLTKSGYETLTLPRALHTTTESNEYTKTPTESKSAMYTLPHALHLTRRANEHATTLTETATLTHVDHDPKEKDVRMTTLIETTYVTVTPSRPRSTSEVTGRHDEALWYPTPEVGKARRDIGTGNTFCMKCGQSHCCELLYPSTQSHEQDVS